MQAGIHVGNKVDKETADNLAHTICAVFKSAAENRMDQSTVVEALRVIRDATAVREVTITNSSINGDRVINVNNGED